MCVRTSVRQHLAGELQLPCGQRATYVRTYVRYVRTLRTHVLAPKMIVSTAPPSTPTASSGDSEEDYGRCRCKNTYVRTHVRTDYVSTTYVRSLRTCARTYVHTHARNTYAAYVRTYVSRKYYRNYVRSYVTYVRTGCRFQWILSIFKRSLGFLVATSKF